MGDKLMEADKYRNITRDELRKFIYRYPDLCLECYDCEGSGKETLDLRLVDCWRCHGLCQIPYLPWLVRHLLGEGE